MIDIEDFFKDYEPAHGDHVEPEVKPLPELEGVSDE